MNLLIYKDGEVQISPEAMVLLPFKKLYEKNKVRTEAAKEMAYIYFMEDKSNEIGFWQIPDDKERSKEVIKHVFGKDSKWKPDKFVIEAQEFYKEQLTPYAARLLNNVLGALQKTQDYLAAIDWELKDKSEKFVYDINKVRDLIIKVPELEETVQKLRLRIKQEEQEEGDNKRGQHKVGMYEGEEDFV